MKQAIQEKLTLIAHTEPLHFLLAAERKPRMGLCFARQRL